MFEAFQLLIYRLRCSYYVLYLLSTVGLLKVLPGT